MHLVNHSARMYVNCIIQFKLSTESLLFFTGVTTTEILIAHIVSQMVCMFMQMAIILILAFWAFDVPCVGNFVTVIVIVGLQGFCGMCFGKEICMQICHLPWYLFGPLIVKSMYFFARSYV
jgi:hypothetical protein